MLATSQGKDGVIRCSGLLCLKELCYPLQMRCILGHAEFVIKEILGAYSLFMTHKVMTIF